MIKADVEKIKLGTVIKSAAGVKRFLCFGFCDTGILFHSASVSTGIGYMNIIPKEDLFELHYYAYYIIERP